MSGSCYCGVRREFLLVIIVSRFNHILVINIKTVFANLPFCHILYKLYLCKLFMFFSAICKVGEGERKGKEESVGREKNKRNINRHEIYRRLDTVSNHFNSWTNVLILRQFKRVFVWAGGGVQVDVSVFKD